MIGADAGPHMRLASAAIALALSSCASYRVLPPPPPAPGVSPLPLRLEKTRLLVFSSTGDEAAIERVFVSPVDPALVIATSAAPEAGVFASSDGGRTFAFTQVDEEEGGADRRLVRGSFAARIFADVLFDPKDARVLYGRSTTRLFRSEDGGRSFEAIGAGWEGADGRVEAAAVSAAGVLFAASAGRLAVSMDHGRSFRTVTLPTEERPRGEVVERPRLRIRSIAADPVAAGSIYLSIAADRPGLYARIVGLLDRSSEQAFAALDLVEAREESPRQFTYGDSRAGVYATQDGGLLWQKTGLSVDCWLSVRGGVLVGVAADPVLEVAALARRYPDLAAAATAQLHGGRIDGFSLKTAVAFVGRERILAGPLGAALVFRSTDLGASWIRPGALSGVEVAAFREPIERQRAAWLETVEPQRPNRSTRGGGGGGGGRGGRRGGRGGGGGGGQGGGQFGGGNDPSAGHGAGPQGAPAQAQSGRARNMPAEVLLSLFDPVRLLARFNSGLPLSALSRGSEGGLWAFAPTPQLWDALANAFVAASTGDGELSTGPGSPTEAGLGGPGFELLRSADGAAWTAQPVDAAALDTDGALQRRGLVPYPSAIGAAAWQTLLPLAARDRGGRPWQRLFRASP